MRHSQDGMVQRRAAVRVASERVGARLDAAHDIGGERHAAEHPPVPVIAVGGVSHPAVLVTGGRIGPEPKEFARDERVRVAPRAIERGGLVTVPRVEICAEFNQRAYHRQVRRIPRSTVQGSHAEVVAGVGVGPEAKAIHYLRGRGRSEETPTAPVIAGLGDGGRRRQEHEHKRESAGAHDRAPPERGTGGSGAGHSEAPYADARNRSRVESRRLPTGTSTILFRSRPIRRRADAGGERLEMIEHWGDRLRVGVSGCRHQSVWAHNLAGKRPEPKAPLFKRCSGSRCEGVRRAGLGHANVAKPADAVLNTAVWPRGHWPPLNPLLPASLPEQRTGRGSRLSNPSPSAFTACSHAFSRHSPRVEPQRGRRRRCGPPTGSGKRAVCRRVDLT